MKNLLAILIVLGIAIAALAGCARSVTQEEPVAAEMPLVRYANFQVYDPVYIGVAKGIFEKHGVNVEIVGTNFGGPTAIQAVSSGKADAGLSSYMAVINAIANGLPIIGVADSQTETPDSPKEVFFVRVDSGIEKIEELQGKTIAVNLVRSSFHYTWLLAFQNIGLTEKDATFVNLPFSAQPEALHRGDVDAGGMMEPYATIAELTYPGEFKRLYIGSDAFGQRQFTVIFVNSVWAEYNPVSAARFVAALKESAVWANENPEEANEIVAKQLDINAADIPFYEFTEDGGVRVEDAQYWLDFMKDSGYISADWMTVDNVVTEYK